MSVYLLSPKDLDRLRELISSLANPDKQLKAVELAALVESIKTSGTKLATDNAALKPQLEATLSELQSLLDLEYSFHDKLDSFIHSLELTELTQAPQEPEPPLPLFEILAPGMPGSSNSPVI